MAISDLSNVLKRAADLFQATGARAQAKEISALAATLDDSGDASVAGFVEQTQEALKRPPLAELPAEKITERLCELQGNTSAFSALLKEMNAKSFDKMKTFTVAAQYTGARETAWTTKPKALKAIKSKFEDSLYLASKAAMNAKVSPW
jgi:hypothetical protein